MPNDVTPSDKKKPRFSDLHLEYLRSRAVSPEFAREAGVMSLPVLNKVTRQQLKSIYKGMPVPPVAGLCVPYRVTPLDGVARCRIRPDTRTYVVGGELEGTTEEVRNLPKWLAQKDVSVIPYYPPQVVRYFNDSKVPVYVVEAPIKALSLTANGFPALGLGGVEAGFHDAEEWRKTKHLVINQELARVDWRGRTVYITYDAGIQNNPSVALGAAKLTQVLRNAGAIVRLVFIPLLVVKDISVEEALTYEATDQGPDDFLGRHGAEGPAKLQALVDEAVPADPVERAGLIVTGRKDQLATEVASVLEDLTFVAGLLVGGNLAIDRVTKLVTKSGIKKRAIQDAVKRLELRLGEARAADPAESLTLPYLVDQGRIAMTVVRGPVSSIRYLTDFTAKITAEVIKDDGVERTREYRIEGSLPDGSPLPPVDVAADAFTTMKWISGLGSKAILRAGRDTQDHVRVAIQHLSTPVSRTIYNHVGWRTVDGRNVYLHPGGAIGGEGIPVEVELGSGKFRLPDATESLPEAVKLALSILDTGDLKVTLPVLAGTFTAVLSSIFEVDFGIWLVGRSGTFKSSIAALCLSLFGSFDYNSLPANWFSTANNIESLLSKWKDALLVVDNFVPSATQQQRELVAKALRIIQALGDRSSRGRNDRNNEERARRDPRGLVLMIGEDLPPTNESTIGRLLVVDVSKGAIILDRIREVRTKVDLLPHAMRGFIEWLAQDFEARTIQAKAIRGDLYEQFRQELQPYAVHERTPNKLATLGAGFATFLTFAHEVGVIDDTMFDYHREKLLETFIELGRAQAANAEAAPTDRYLSTLKTLLLQGRINLAPVDEGLDMNTTPSSKAVGWLDRARGEVFLVPELAWEAIEDFLGKDRWPFRQTRLHKQLIEQGILKHEEGDDGKERTSCRRTAGRRTVRVHVFEYETFSDVLDVEGRKKPKTIEAEELKVLLDRDLHLN